MVIRSQGCQVPGYWRRLEQYPCYEHYGEYRKQVPA
jgi:hypothetical protein